jgi:hypothetical protein
VQLLVIGSGLRQVCGDQQALGLTFVAEARTAPRYRLYSFSNTFAALVKDDEAGVAVRGELVEVTAARFAELLASEPVGIEQAPVELEDGRIVSSAFAKPNALGRGDVVEITAYADFASYLSSIGATRASRR